MPILNDITSILVIGSGPVVIGQACEFDYSAVQACRSLKEAGYKVILVNSNPATIMTEYDFVDVVYVEPITEDFVASIVAKEKPSAILPTVGGQLSINITLSLSKKGILDKYNVKILGVTVDALMLAEDRESFSKFVSGLGFATPKNIIIQSLSQIDEILENFSFPLIIRPSFTLGGLGGGIAYNIDDLTSILKYALSLSPASSVQIDQSVLGWKEFEAEVIKDSYGNLLLVAILENINPMGVHTGDSVVVCPAMTITDKEYQLLRDIAFSIVGNIGITASAANVQFSMNPETGEVLVVEMNPRLSRSSTLVSKATGFPISKISTKLAVGYSFAELENDFIKGATAFFEPSLDYVVVKFPRFSFDIFNEADNTLGTSMKSVGEVIAIGGNFCEALQKAVISLEEGRDGIIDNQYCDLSIEDLILHLTKLTPELIYYIAAALYKGISVDRVCEYTKFDKWFVEKINNIVTTEKDILSGDLSLQDNLLEIKKLGFSDKRLAYLYAQHLRNIGSDDAAIDSNYIRKIRQEADVNIVYHHIDTCSSEFLTKTNCFYSLIGRLVENELETNDTEKVIIIGSGPNRIGQGIEFDYSCVQAVLAIKELGYEAIMVNCNPSTVSTDYDIADKLYLVPLTAEEILNVIKNEEATGKIKAVMLQFGGQTSLKMAESLYSHGYLDKAYIEALNRTEDRSSFSKFLTDLNIQYPNHVICQSIDQLQEISTELNFPYITRPSYIIGGKGMQIINNKEECEDYTLLIKGSNIFADGSVLVEEFLINAIEVDVDLLFDGQNTVVLAVMEHVETAGIHSGDSACSIRPFSLSQEIIDKIKKITTTIITNLNIRGVSNIQLAVQSDEIYVIEVNLRASRTLPLIAKATGEKVISYAVRSILGESFSPEEINNLNSKLDFKDYHVVKEAVFAFHKFPDIDATLGPKMYSTGEVMGIDCDFHSAFLKSQIAIYGKFNMGSSAFISVKDNDKELAIGLAQKLNDLGFEIFATKGTAVYLQNASIKVTSINKIYEGTPNIVDQIKQGKVDLVINTTEGKKSLHDSASIRTNAILNNIPYYTTMRSAVLLVDSLHSFFKKNNAFEVIPLVGYYNK